MSHLDPNHRRGDSCRSPTTPTTVEQLIRDEDSQFRLPHSNSSSPTSRGHDVHDPEDIHYHPKKLTVLAKVKEKARRWRHSFIKKRQSEGENATPSWGVRLEDDEEDEDPEYLGAPMYESELAPEGYKENARQHPRAYPVISEKHVLPNSVKPAVSSSAPPPTDISETDDQKKKGQGGAADEEVDKYATQETDVDKHTLNTNNPISPRENKWDKGVSVKEYIKNKFEPGADEKALSQVIAEAMSPRRAPGDVSVIEKVKGAVNSLLWKEEHPQPTMDKLAISNNDKAAVMEEENNKGRILQTN